MYHPNGTWLVDRLMRLNLAHGCAIDDVLYVLVKAPVRVQYGKYCTRHLPSTIFPIVHELNRCFNWLIVEAEKALLSPVSTLYYTTVTVQRFNSV